MKYYVTADIHGLYFEFHKALGEAGYFTDPDPHKLIILGDLFDRGLEAVEMQQFVLQLIGQDDVILILDEATANLDAKTEEEVKKGLAALMRGRTVIEIAHSASAIRSADHVIVLDAGRVAASGTPEELEQSNAFFRQLVREG